MKRKLQKGERERESGGRAFGEVVEGNGGKGYRLAVEFYQKLYQKLDCRQQGSVFVPNLFGWTILNSIRFTRDF